MSVGDKIKSAVGSSEGASRLLGSKKKKAVAGGALLAVIVAVAAAVFLNMDRSGEYVTLYPGISREENSEIMAVLSSCLLYTSPILILHGDCDKLVPWTISEDFYNRIVDAGMEDRAEFYILQGAGHGTKEFFQAETKALILRFFDRCLRQEAF